MIRLVLGQRPRTGIVAATLVVGCGLLDDDRDGGADGLGVEADVLTSDERLEHNAPAPGAPCSLPPSAKLKAGTFESISLDLPDGGTEALVATLDDCENIVLAWSTTSEATVARFLASGDLDFQTQFTPTRESSLSALTDLSTDSYGSIFASSDVSLLRVTAAGSAYPKAHLLDLSGKFLSRDAESFLVGLPGLARVNLSTLETAWQSPAFNSHVPRAGLLGGSAINDRQLLSLFVQGEAAESPEVRPPIGGGANSSALVVYLEEPPRDRNGVEPNVVATDWDFTFSETFTAARIAVAGDRYAVGFSLGVGESECRSVLTVPRLNAEVRVPGCLRIEDIAIGQDGAVWTLWSGQQESKEFQLWHWSTDRGEPVEVELAYAGAGDAKSNGQVLGRHDGSALVALVLPGEDRVVLSAEDAAE